MYQDLSSKVDKVTYIAAMNMTKDLYQNCKDVSAWDPVNVEKYQKCTNEISGSSYVIQESMRNIQIGWLLHDLQRFKWDIGANWFEVRMRGMNLLVGCIMAIVFCAPNQKFIHQPRLSKKSVSGVGPWPACRTSARCWTRFGLSWWW